MRLSGIADYYGIWLEGSGFCAEGYSGASWYNGHGALNVGVDSSKGGNNQTSLIVAYKKGSNAAHTGTDRFFDIGVLNDGTMTRVSIMGGPILDFTKTKIEAYKLLNAKAGIQIGNCTITYDSTNSGLHFSTGIYSDGYVSAKGANTAGLSGTILTTANVHDYMPRVAFMSQFFFSNNAWDISTLGYNAGGVQPNITTSGHNMSMTLPAAWFSSATGQVDNIYMPIVTPLTACSTPIRVRKSATQMQFTIPTDCTQFQLCVLVLGKYPV